MQAAGRLLCLQADTLDARRPKHSQAAAFGPLLQLLVPKLSLADAQTVGQVSRACRRALHAASQQLRTLVQVSTLLHC